jgi:hypothetical protein
MPTIIGDYRLKAGSLAINAGADDGYLDTWEKWYNFFGTSGVINSLSKYTTYIAPYIDKDLAGKTRTVYAIDMGAFEDPAGVGPRLIALTINDEGTGAFSQGAFTIYKTPTGSQSGEQILTLTGTGYSNPIWLVDGVEKGRASSITLKASDYMAGGHSLTLMVKTDSGYWSKGITFTVN